MSEASKRRRDRKKNSISSIKSLNNSVKEEHAKAVGNSKKGVPKPNIRERSRSKTPGIVADDDVLSLIGDADEEKSEPVITKEERAPSKSVSD